MAFLKTLLILLLIYYGFRLIWRWIRPYVFRYIQRKAQKHFNKTFGGTPFGEETIKKEGEVSIDKMPGQKKQQETKVGQYVDYEEID